MYAQLMTAVKCESKGFGIGDTSCRVCNYFAEYENLRHLLLECKAPQIIDARKKVILDVCNAVKQYGLNPSSVRHFSSLWYFYVIIPLVHFLIMILLMKSMNAPFYS